MTVKVFIGGIIQGSNHGRDIHRQDYREEIRSILKRCHPDWEIYCPFHEHPDSVSYPPEKAKKIFLDHIRQASESDLLVVYLPEASMGTAIEMFRAYHDGRCRVVTISPLDDNWVVRFCSHLVYQDLEGFERGVRAGEITGLLRSRATEKKADDRR